MKKKIIKVNGIPLEEVCLRGNEIRDMVEDEFLALSKVMDVSEPMRKLDEFKAIKKPKRKTKAYYLQAIKDIKMYYQLSTIKGYKKAGLEGIISTVDLALKGEPLHYKFKDSEISSKRSNK